MKKVFNVWLHPVVLIVAISSCSPQDHPEPLQNDSGSLQDRSGSRVSSDTFPLTGTVVDESGNPVPGIEVELRLFGSLEPLKTKTDQDGGFSFPVEHYSYVGALLFARQENGRVSAFHEYEFTATDSKTTGPIELRLQRGKKTSVHVVDREGNDIEGATVKAFLARDTLITGQTNSDGLLELRYPDNAKIRNVITFKLRAGFDYFNNFKRKSGSVSPIINPNLPNKLEFVFDGAKTLRILALDSNGNPVPNEAFAIDEILISGEKKGRHATRLNGNDRDFQATTDKSGVAEFQWFPRNYELANASLCSAKYTLEREIEISDHGKITATLMRRNNLTVNATFPDGKPAAGIGIRVMGHQELIFAGSNRDGIFKMALKANNPYVIWIADENWTAPIQKIYLREASKGEELNLRLSKGTVVSGTVTVGIDKKAAVDRSVSVKSISDEKQEGKQDKENSLRFNWEVKTDQYGQYRFRLPPGKYRLEGPGEAGTQDVILTTDSKLVRNFHISRQDKGILEGVVILKKKDRDGKTLPPFNIQGVSDIFLGHPDLIVKTDESGHFETQRWLDEMVIFARSPDRSLGGVITISPNETKIEIPVAPTATVTGIAHDSSGKPIVRQAIHCGIPKLREITSFECDCYGPNVRTDKNGRFEFRGLITGQTYEVSILGMGSLEFEVKDAKRIDLGSILFKEQ